MTSARFGTAGMGSTTFAEDRSRTRNALADPVYNRLRGIPRGIPRRRTGGPRRGSSRHRGRHGRILHRRQLSPRQPVPRRLTGDIAEYGCRAEEHGIRANRMPNPKRLEIALDARKGAGCKVLSRCVLHIVTPPNRTQAPHTKMRLSCGISRQRFARSGAPLRFFEIAHSGVPLRFFEISAFLSILAGARRAQKRERWAYR